MNHLPPRLLVRQEGLALSRWRQKGCRGAGMGDGALLGEGETRKPPPWWETPPRRDARGRRDWEVPAGSDGGDFCFSPGRQVQIYLAQKLKKVLTQ